MSVWRDPLTAVLNDFSLSDPPSDPTLRKYAAAAGTGIERSELQRWKQQLGSGWQTYLKGQKASWPHWIRTALPGHSIPDLVAINARRRAILVGDVTAQPNEKHYQKTMQYARKVASRLDPVTKGYAVFMRERYWGIPKHRRAELGLLGPFDQSPLRLIKRREPVRRASRELEMTEWENPTTQPAAKPVTAGKWIDVDLGNQILRAMIGNRAIRRMNCSTGIQGHRTPTGRFKIGEKKRQHRSSLYGSCLIASGLRRAVSQGRIQCVRGERYEGTPMPFMQRLVGAPAIAIHQGRVTPGCPASHGCLRLNQSDARWLYSWTEKGIPVRVRGVTRCRSRSN